MEQQAEMQALRQRIEAFLEERRAEKLKKSGADETELAEIRDRFRRESWLADAARRSSQIRLVTHALKYTHPDARGSSLYAAGERALPEGYVGTDARLTLHEDVVGNAAALDVFKFLKLEQGGKTLLQRVMENDESLLAAFSDDRALAESWAAAFRRMWEADTQPASHALAKQIYFPLEDGGYHLLAPLFPTSLVQQVYETLREDRFGEETKAARAARREGLSYAHGYREYPHLMTQKFGGTKPQNISQLNSERHGENWLLALLPPVWEMGRVRLPLGMTSVFPTLGRLKEVRRAREMLVKFLERTAGEYTNIRIRETRGTLLEDLVTAVIQWAARIRSEPAGWTADAACELAEDECFWLDPGRGETDPEWQEKRTRGEWVETLLAKAASWCNRELTSKILRMGDEEHRAWKKELAEAIRQLEEGGMA